MYVCDYKLLLYERNDVLLQVCDKILLYLRDSTLLFICDITQ